MTFKSEKDFLEVSLLVAAIFALLSLGFAGIKLGDFTNSAQQDMTRMTQQIDRMVIITTGTATNIEKATRSINEKETAEYTQIQAMSKKLNTIADNANDSILALNGTLGSLNTLVKNSDARMQTLTADADQDVKDLHPVLVSLNGVLGSAKTELDELPLTTQAFRTDLQKLGPILDNTGTITKNLGHATGTLDDLATWFYKKMTNPVTSAKAAAIFTWNSLLKVLGPVL